MTREALIQELFPSGIPRLWCPLITHFAAPAEPDPIRTEKHLRSISPSVKGLLIPGSTGEGWDMSDEDILTLLSTVLPAASKAGQLLLIGALKSTAAEMLQSIDSALGWLKDFSGSSDRERAMRESGVVGFTVCPPQGADLSQKEIKAGLERVLELGLPTAIYQLPQVTKNEISPETTAELSGKYPNFFLFKDTSGADRVATAELEYEGIFLVRGAEGGYADWTTGGGGPYDGLLLSSANSFSEELGSILTLLDAGKRQAAKEISARISAAVEKLFPEAGKLPAGNAFANANKVFDHYRAWGRTALETEPPLLYGGLRLPRELIELGGKILEANNFELGPGYMRG